jgi:hypothetical protein
MPEIDQESIASQDPHTCCKSQMNTTSQLKQNHIWKCLYFEQASSNSALLPT